MSSSKIAITLEPGILKEIDTLVKKHMFPSRSRAIPDAVQEKLERIQHNLLAQECAKLDPDAEKVLAEEGLGKDSTEWVHWYPQTYLLEATNPV